MSHEGMVERVAEAMFNDARDRQRPRPYADWDDSAEHTRNAWLLAARAAIEEMRSPTEKMVDAGVFASERQSVSAIYRAMIGAAAATGQTNMSHEMGDK